MKGVFNTKENTNLLGFSLGFCILIILLITFNSSVRSDMLTQKFFDPIRNTSERGEVVIVGIDDKSLQNIGAWPFNRSVFARLNEKLNNANVKAIVYDVLFLESRAGDDELLKSIKDSTVPIVFASKFTSDGYLESYFASTTQFTSSASAHIYPDNDGQVRAIPNDFGLSDNCVTSLSKKAFSIFTHQPVACDVSSKSFFRYPNNIKTISLVDLLDNKIDKKTLENKVIFIGSTSLDLEDHFVGINGSKIPGVFVHASIFTSLLNKDIDILVKNTTSNLIILLLALFVTYFAYKAKSFFKQTLLFFTLIILIVSISYFSFEYHFILPLPTMVITIFIFEGYTILFRFIKERKKNEYIQNIFAKYVSEEVLKELLVSEKPIHLGGEKRRVSILFSDIRGFTSFSEIMTPEQLTSLLNAYLSAMSPIILENKGTIDKYIGDAIMAFWNAPLYTPNHETSAVLSAVSMQETLTKFNKDNNTDIKIGVGVHVGDVVVGNVGSSERINYTILGDVVNTTSRLEGLTKKYGVGVIVTEEIKKCVTDKRISYRKLDVITVKGKKEPTIIYETFFNGKINANTVSSYESAFAFYQKSEWNKAKEILEKISNDRPSHNLLERIKIIESGSGLHSFDKGVWHFDEK